MAKSDTEGKPLGGFFWRPTKQFGYNIGYKLGKPSSSRSLEKALSRDYVLSCFILLDSSDPIVVNWDEVAHNASSKQEIAV